MKQTVILLIEDNPVDSKLMRLLLEACGKLRFKVVTAGTLAAGIQTAMSESVDLVLLDLNLPDSAGLDTLRHLLTSFPTIAIVVITGVEEEQQGLEALRLGAQDYLLKGQFSERELKRVMQFAIERKKMKDDLRESERRFRAYFQENKSVMLLVDRKALRIADANSAAAQYYGYSVDQLKQMKISEINQMTPEEIAEKVQSAAIRTENVSHFSHRLSSGEIRQVEVYSTPLEVDRQEMLLSIVHDVSERVRLEESVRESEANFLCFFNSIDDFLFVLDAGGHILHVNQTVLDRLEYKEAELIGRSVLEVHPEHQRAEAGQTVEKMLSGTVDFCPIPLISKNGELIPVETRVTTGTWNGAPALFGVSKDLSALKISEEKLSKIFQTTTALMAVSTLEEGIYLDVNDAFLSTLGFERSEVIGKRSTDLHILRDPESRNQWRQQLLQDGKVRNREVELRNRSGKTIFGLFSADIVKVAEYRLLISTVTDVTELKLTEKALQASEERFSLSMEATRDGLWDWNLLADTCYYSPGYYQMLGYANGEFPMEIKNWLALVHPADCDIALEANTDCREGRRNSFETEFRMMTKSGEWRWILSRGKSAGFDEQGRATRMVGTHVDITERKQAEETQRRNALIQSVLREIADAASTAPSLEELYATVNRLTNQVLPSDIFHLALLDETNKQIVDGYSRDSSSYVAKRRPVGKGLTEYTLKQGRTLHITADVLQQLLACGEVVRQTDSPIQEWLGAPLFTSTGEKIGVLAVISRISEHLFQPDDCEVLSIIAAQVSMAIERKQAEEKIRAGQERYRALMEQSSEAQAVVDIETQEIVEINRRYSELFGYSLPEDAPLYVSRVTIESPSITEERYGKTLKQQRFLPLEVLRLRRRNGTAVVVERTGTVITLDGRDFLLASMRDMTIERLREAELSRDVGLASRVQRELLPTLPVSPLINLRSLFYPSHLVGGDSYQMEWQNGGTLLRGFLIDVSGHGVATALQTASISVLLREAAAAPTPLLEQVQRINAQASKYFVEASYATLLGFDLDLFRRELRYVGAGITSFYVNGRKIDTPGMFVGMFEDAEFETGVFPVAEGDCFYFLTDGFTDALAQPENNNFWSPDGKDFEADVAALERLAESGTLRDDATGVCFKIMDLMRQEKR